MRTIHSQCTSNSCLCPQTYAHISTILNIPSMHHPSANKLRAMVDTTDEHLRMLNRHGMKTELWSPMVCVVLLGKLDMETRNRWEGKDNLPDAPDLAALFAFLEQRILAMRNVEQSTHQYQARTPLASTNNKSQDSKYSKSDAADRKRPYPNERKQPSNPFENKGERYNAKDRQQASAMECPMCMSGDRHYLWKCDNFKALKSNEQLDNLAKWAICEVCLVAKHPAANCTKGQCPVCKNGRHNSLICPQAKGKRVNHVRGGKRRRSAGRSD